MWFFFFLERRNCTSNDLYGVLEWGYLVKSFVFNMRSWSAGCMVEMGVDSKGWFGPFTLRKSVGVGREVDLNRMR